MTATNNYSHNIKRSDWENSAAKMQNTWSVVDLLHQNPHWLSPILSSAYGVNLDSRLLDKILCIVDRSDMPWLLVQSVLSSPLWIGTMIDYLHCSSNSSSFKIELTLRLLMFYIYIYIYIYMEHLFLMFLDLTQRRTAVGRTPLYEWSARRRDLYLTTHDTHNRQISMPRWDSNPQSQQVSGLWPLTCWDRGFESHRGMDICLLWVSCVVR